MPTEQHHLAPWSDGHVQQARDSFGEFVTACAPLDVGERDVYLEPLLAAWLGDDSGIDLTAGLYDHFLQVVLAVTDAILTGALTLDYRGPDAPAHPRRLAGLQDPRAATSVLNRIGHDRFVQEVLEDRRVEDVRVVFNALQLRK
jgi:hypothetical protein